MTVEDVVAEHQRHALAAHESLADEEGLGQAFGTRLLGIGQREAHCAPSPSNRSNSGRSSGVEISRMSRIPASIRVESG